MAAVLNSFFLSEAWTGSWSETLGGDAALPELDLPGGGHVPLAGRRREAFRFLRLAGGELADYEELPLSDGENDWEDLAAAVDRVLAEGPWDVLQLAFVPEGAPGLRWAGWLSDRWGGRRVRTFPRGESYVTKLASSWEEQRGRFRKKLLADADRCRRRLAEAEGPVRVERLRERDELTEAVRTIAERHRLRHTSLGRFSMFERPETEAFYLRLVERAADDDRLHVTRLLAGDRVAAVHLGFDTGERFLYYLPTFDQGLSRYSPGRLLLLDLMKEAIEGGRRAFDLGRGEESYKLEFDPERLAVHTVLITRPGVRGALAGRWFAGMRPWLGRHLGVITPWLHRRGILRESS
jgi:CelD/BcsL family acetyltransferase involved in cellulose biosynthesis